MVYVTHIHLSPGGSRHEHITDLKWRNPSTAALEQSTRAAMVDWIANKGGDARVRDNRGHDVRVGVVQATPPYIRTLPMASGRTTSWRSRGFDFRCNERISDIRHDLGTRAAPDTPRIEITIDQHKFYAGGTSAKQS